MLSTFQQETVIKLVKIALEGHSYPDKNKLEDATHKALLMFQAMYPDSSIGEDDFQIIRDKWEDEQGVSQALGIEVVDENQLPWMRQRMAETEMFYWDRYRNYLINEKNWSKEIVDRALDEDTSRILDLCGDPSREESWDRRGMVMGYVQSGKTANYIGLINKAADMGYKVFIVITGILEELRRQTQERVDEGFIGRDSGDFEKTENIGVGIYSDDMYRPSTLTSTRSDFVGKSNQANFFVDGMKAPVVFVVKKNTSTLKKLANWLKVNGKASGQNEIHVPVMVIDDEADNASINTKYSPDDETNITKINEQIRKILNLFSHNTYVGYTATPFANIFIDPDVYSEEVKQDLFPRSFIYALEPSSNYFGADMVFSDDENYLEIINDDEVYLPINHQKDFELQVLPPSLKEALRYFVLSTAIRYARGQNNDNISMMVNVSRFKNVHKSVADCIKSYLKTIIESVYYCGCGSKDDVFLSLEDTWEKYRLGELCEWEKSLKFVHLVLKEIEVLVINSASGDSLHYSQEYGRKIIAVGGFSLSRGLTLEGLHVSYLIRNSNMYDTLMQMGRWFGYRVGYQDLCKLFLTSDVKDRYQRISEATSDLRDELRLMSRLGRTPKDFGLKVKTYPGALMVTARNKMKAANKVTISLDYAGKLVDSSRLYIDGVALTNNRAAVVDFVKQLKNGQNSSLREKNGWLFRGISKELVIEFFEKLDIPMANEIASTKLIIKYLESTKSYQDWDVLFPSLQKGEVTPFSQTLGLDIVPQRRTLKSDNRLTEFSTGRMMAKFPNSRVSSRGIASSGMTQEEMGEAQRYADTGKEAADKDFLLIRKNPLLAVHIASFVNEKSEECFDDVVAFTVAFPMSVNNRAESITYVVNKVEYDELLNIRGGGALYEDDEDE